MDIAEEAQKIIKERQEEYGPPARNLGRIAAAVNALYGTDFKAHDIAVIMGVVKMSRIIEHPTKKDSWLDLIGYSMAAAKAAEEEGDPLK